MWKLCATVLEEPTVRIVSAEERDSRSLRNVCTKPRGITSQKTEFVMPTTAVTSNLT